MIPAHRQHLPAPPREPRRAVAVLAAGSGGEPGVGVAAQHRPGPGAVQFPEAPRPRRGQLPAQRLVRHQRSICRARRHAFSSSTQAHTSPAETSNPASRRRCPGSAAAPRGRCGTPPPQTAARGAWACRHPTSSHRQTTTPPARPARPVSAQRPAEPERNPVPRPAPAPPLTNKRARPLSLRFKLPSSLSVFAGGRFALVVGRSLGFGAVLPAFRAAGTGAGGFGRAGGCAD